MIALAWYKLSFATLDNQEMRTYFDPVRDGVYLAARNIMSSEGINLIKRMVWEASTPFIPLLLIGSFHEVKDVILIRGNRMSPPVEATLAEMTMGDQELVRHWRHSRDKMCEFFDQLFPDQALAVRQLQSIAAMELAELDQIIQRACLNGIFGFGETDIAQRLATAEERICLAASTALGTLELIRLAIIAYHAWR